MQVYSPCPGVGAYSASWLTIEWSVTVSEPQRLCDALAATERNFSSSSSRKQAPKLRILSDRRLHNYWISEAGMFLIQPRKPPGEVVKTWPAPHTTQQSHHIHNVCSYVTHWIKISERWYSNVFSYNWQDPLFLSAEWGQTISIAICSFVGNVDAMCVTEWHTLSTHPSVNVIHINW